MIHKLRTLKIELTLCIRTYHAKISDSLGAQFLQVVDIKFPRQSGFLCFHRKIIEKSKH